jgi:hypothetical protein
VVALAAFELFCQKKNAATAMMITTMAIPNLFISFIVSLRITYLTDVTHRPEGLIGKTRFFKGTLRDVLRKVSYLITRVRAGRFAEIVEKICDFSRL